MFDNKLDQYRPKVSPEKRKKKPIVYLGPRFVQKFEKYVGPRNKEGPFSISPCEHAKSSLE